MKKLLLVTATLLVMTPAVAAHESKENVKLILSTYGAYQVASEYPEGGYVFQVDASGFGGDEEGCTFIGNPKVERTRVRDVTARCQ
jgi:hypothetical protein